MSIVTRAEREIIFDCDLANRVCGFAREPSKTEMLDLFDRFDSEGLTQMVNALFSEIKRSGHIGGYLLEFTTAESLLETPIPRLLRCEQQEGQAKVPGDIWMDLEGRRYEFQCKNSMNWTAELWIDEAVDGIVAATQCRLPGRYLNLIPTKLGSQSDWMTFRDFIVDKYRYLAVDEDYDFYTEGKLITQYNLLPAEGSGVRCGARTNPGGVIFMDLSHLRRKISAALREGRRSFSAIASLRHINCLVISFANPIVNIDDIFSALYLRSQFPSESEEGTQGSW
jgi:hypothetical protein